MYATQRKNENGELQDIREILKVIVQRMVTKEEFYAALDRMMTKEEFAAFEAETRQNFREVREDIAGLRKENGVGTIRLTNHRSRCFRRIAACPALLSGLQFGDGAFNAGARMLVDNHSSEAMQPREAELLNRNRVIYRGG